MESYPLSDWIKRFDNGEFDKDDMETQIKAGWYDWFCQTSSLRNKTYKLAPKVKQIAKSSKINSDKVYLFFKNNCPCIGKLYDDFRICNIETGNVVYTVVPKSGYKTDNGEAQVFGEENNFEEALARGSWKDIKNYFEI